MLQMINDPIGTRLKANTAFKPNGCVVVLQSAIPAFDQNKDLEGNIGSKLRFSYGPDFWEAAAALSQSVDAPPDSHEQLGCIFKVGQWESGEDR